MSVMSDYSKFSVFSDHGARTTLTCDRCFEEVDTPASLKEIIEWADRHEVEKHTPDLAVGVGMRSHDVSHATPESITGQQWATVDHSEDEWKSMGPKRDQD